MHEQADRLYRAAQELRGVSSQVGVARLLGVSAQVIANWEKRGVSSAGAVQAQQLIGCNPIWLLRGTGVMAVAEKGTAQYSVFPGRTKIVWVVGRGEGGMPERIWTDGDYPVGATDEFGEVATADPHAFLIPITGSSMVPRYMPGEFALVEPGTEPEIEDDVLVRLQTGETLLKRLLSRRNGWRFGSYNDPAVLTYTLEQVEWVYYVAHPVPARKIKTRL